MGVWGRPRLCRRDGDAAEPQLLMTTSKPAGPRAKKHCTRLSNVSSVLGNVTGGWYMGRKARQNWECVLGTRMNGCPRNWRATHDLVKTIEKNEGQLFLS